MILQRGHLVETSGSAKDLEHLYEKQVFKA